MDNIIKYNTIIFDGMDRCGKSSQIRLLEKYLCYKPYAKIHYSNIKGINEQKYYQIMFDGMFKLIKNNKDITLIFDRAHIGEAVYANKYRNYNGNYVFDLEKIYDLNNTILFILIDSSLNCLNRDDGLSLSTNKEDLIDEINLFKDAYNKSSIKNKYLIDIYNKSIEEVHKDIIMELVKK